MKGWFDFNALLHTARILHHRDTMNGEPRREPGLEEGS